MLYKKYIFQYMGQIFCVEFQRVPLNSVDFIHGLKFKSS